MGFDARRSAVFFVVASILLGACSSSSETGDNGGAPVARAQEDVVVGSAGSILTSGDLLKSLATGALSGAGSWAAGELLSSWLKTGESAQLDEIQDELDSIESMLEDLKSEIDKLEQEIDELSLAVDIGSLRDARETITLEWRAFQCILADPDAAKPDQHHGSRQMHADRNG